MAASAFYKRFDDPIELTILDPVTGGSQFRNGTRAQNLGGEFELRLNLGRAGAPRSAGSISTATWPLVRFAHRAARPSWPGRCAAAGRWPASLRMSRTCH